MKTPKYYYSTRDLLMMAALAALGGISSTYINLIGDLLQSFLGFAGTTQWAAGLHVLWLILAVGLTKKQGAGTITGILKGAVELFSGNTHGLLVLLVDLAAGLLVDLSLLPFKNKQTWPALSLAGGLAAASNVFVFQFFAALPADILTFGLIGLIALVAFGSGVVFAGLLGSALLAALSRSGVTKDLPPEPLGRKGTFLLVAGALIIGGSLFGYLKLVGGGADGVALSGALAEPYIFNSSTTALSEEIVAVENNGVTASYRGYLLAEIINRAGPTDDYDLVLLFAADGYVFLISRDELDQNPAIALQGQASGKNEVYNVVGPISKKAWVNGVVEIRVIQSSSLEIEIKSSQYFLAPADWIGEMDSTTLDVGYGKKKYQGVPLVLILDSFGQDLEGSQIQVLGSGDETLNLSFEEVFEDRNIRIFVILDQGQVSFALANMNGDVYLSRIDKVRIP